MKLLTPIPGWSTSLCNLVPHPQAPRKCLEAFRRPLSSTSSFQKVGSTVERSPESFRGPTDIMHSLPGPWEGPTGQAMAALKGGWQLMGHSRWRLEPHGPLDPLSGSPLTIENVNHFQDHENINYNRWFFSRPITSREMETKPSNL